MPETQRQVLQVLLKSLHDQGLLAKATYEVAVNMVNSNIDLPESFWYPVCCRQAPAGAVQASNRAQRGSWRVAEEDKANGCTENQK